MFGLPPKYDPDNPYTNQAKFRNYLGGLYDTAAARAQKGGLAPRMGRDEFIDAAMQAGTSTYKEKEQQSNFEKLIGDLESR